MTIVILLILPPSNYVVMLPNKGLLTDMISVMSNTTGIFGGEIALKAGSSNIMKVRARTKIRKRNPLEDFLWLDDKGCAIVLQGRYVEHQALQAFVSWERITMATSFCPRSPVICDDTILNTLKPVSHL